MPPLGNGSTFWPPPPPLPPPPGRQAPPLVVGVHGRRCGGDVARRVLDDVVGDGVEDGLVEAVAPDELLGGHPRVVALVERQLRRRAVEVDVEEVVVLLPLVRPLAERRAAAAAVLRADDLAHLVPRALARRPRVQRRLPARRVLDDLVLALALARVGERLLARHVRRVEAVALRLLRRQRHRRHRLLEEHHLLVGRRAFRRLRPHVRVAVGAAGEEVAVRHHRRRPHGRRVGDRLHALRVEGPGEG